MNSTFRTYYWLTKPGIVYGNAIPAAAGFFLASRGHINLGLFAAMLVGLSLVVASACVFNNYLDRGIDAVMARTKRRALPTHKVSGRAALTYATILGTLGTATLAAFTNPLTTATALFGLFMYVVVYGYAKRRSPWGTEVGSISGAVPPVVGYVSVTGRIDAGALILFLILVLWQMPHFYAIAVYRLTDYKAAKIPVLPAVKGIRATKIRMVIYLFAFIFSTVLLATFGYTGFVYLLVVAALDAVWFNMVIRGFKAQDDTKWAKQVFRFSLIVLTVASLMMSLDFRPV